MATKVLIGNKLTSIPGVYTQIKSGIRNTPLQLSYGNIMVIDKGDGAGYIGGSGISGENYQGRDSVYEFTTIQEFRAFCRGGKYWKLAENLFSPAGTLPGISKLFFVKAAETTSSTLTISFGDSDFIFKTKDEGTVGNGVLNSLDELKLGYAVKVSQSPFNPGSFRFSFYIGSYKGLDGALPWDGVTENESVGNLLFTSAEFKKAKEFKEWADYSEEFNSMFSVALSGTEVELTTDLLLADLTTLGTGYKLFSGGTETYSSTHFDTVLDEASGVDNTFFLAPDSGLDALSTYNSKLLFHIQNETKYAKFLVIGAGTTKSEFKESVVSSTAVAKAYNSQNVIVVHGGYREVSSISRSLIDRDVSFKAASILGRLCGLAPQTPITFKSFNWASELHNLTEQEKEFALDSGILCTVKDTELGYVCLQGINSLQKNLFLVNEDATSHSIAVNRITSQLNKEIAINAKLKFFSSETGFNRGTATSEDIKTWLFGFLLARTSDTSNPDRLLVSFRDIEVQLEADCYRINYGFVPNFEINKMIFTGLMLEN